MRLKTQGVLSEDEATTLHLLAGYRNRLVHFYHEVSAEELYQICSQQLSDIELVQDAYRRWLQEHPEKLEQAL